MSVPSGGGPSGTEAAGHGPSAALPYGSLPGTVGRPRPTSLAGPVTLTAFGALLLVAAAVAAVLVVRGFVALLPTDVLRADGTPGPAVVASGTAPGTATASLDAGARYVVVLAVDDDVEATFDGEVKVIAPDGTTFVADDAPGVSLSTTMGGVHARTVVAFQAAGAGAYTLAVPGTDVDGARFLVVPDEDVAPFVAGVFTTVGATFAALALGGVGLAVTVGGGVWWGLRASARRQARVAA
ncbi:hypothetical protein [Cellulomonas massiliensis]|uniref:hypothetical protein n=1 Tax=Cellulomonas massiliensis TaxID=1465811 RepID=UPI0003180F2D|nr:hypothetical protein [Cellulomonas massiliensis]